MSKAIDKGYAHPEVLVSTEWVAQHMDDADVRCCIRRAIFPGLWRSTGPATSTIRCAAII
jgi:hypothetical protein